MLRNGTPISESTWRLAKSPTTTTSSWRGRGSAAEIQINTPQNVVAKEAVHDAYEEASAIIRSVNPDDGRIAPRLQELEDEMESVYDAARRIPSERPRDVAQQIVQIPDAAERAAAARKSLSEMGVPLRSTEDTGKLLGPGSYARQETISSPRSRTTGTPSTSKNSVPAGKGPAAVGGTEGRPGSAVGTGDTIEPSLSGAGGETPPDFSVTDLGTKSNGTSVRFGRAAEGNRMKIRPPAEFGGNPEALYRVGAMDEMVTIHERHWRTDPANEGAADRLEP